MGQRKFVRLLFGSVALGACAVTGCSGTRDLLTSQRFQERPFETLFGSEDPVEVLVNNPNEGDARVRAMRKLEEPSKNGKAGQQDQVMTILQASATTDQRALCRMAAVEALARFDDQRSVEILLTAYQNAPFENPATKGAVQTVAGRTVASSFTPEVVKMLQCQVLEALGKHRHPDALKLLCEVAAMPTEKPKPAIEPAGGFPSFDLGLGNGLPEAERNDVRMAAIRALGQYEKEALAIKTLVGLLQTEREVGIIGRAHISLVAITGHDFPPDGAVWADWLAKDGKPRTAGLFN